MAWRKLHAEHLLLALDLAGTAFFSAGGAAAAIAAHLDLFGVLVFSFVASSGGGVIRDLLIGGVPPAAIRDWRYLAVSLAAGGAAFAMHGLHLEPNFWVVAVLDAAGLAFYSVAGALKTIEFGLNPLAAVIMAAITGVGGGVLRDLMLAQVPLVLRVDFLATAAMLGATVAVVLLRAGKSSRLSSFLGVLTCFVLRMLAVALHWHLPHF